MQLPYAAKLDSFAYALWVIAIAIAFVGIYRLAHASLAWIRADRRCSNCGYDLTGLTNDRCPECAEPIHHRRRQRIRFFVRLAAASALSVPLFLLLHPKHLGQVITAILPKTQSQTTQVGSCRVRVFAPFRLPLKIELWVTESLTEWYAPAYDADCRAIVTDPDGNVLVDVSNKRINVGYSNWRFGSPPPIGTGEDLDGDQVPDMIVESATSGNHTRYRYDIVSVGTPARVIASLSGMEPQIASMSNSEGKATSRITLQDDAWFAWSTCMICATPPTVVYNLHGGVLTVDISELAKQSPSEKELDRSLKIARRTLSTLARTGEATRKSWSVFPTECWNPAVLLLYSGREADAWAYLDEAWPDAVPGKAEVLADFKANLAQSRHWPAVHAAFQAQQLSPAPPAP